MMKAQKALIGTRETRLRLGNHAVHTIKHPITGDILIKQFTYFDNKVCEVNFLHGLFFIDKCGWEHSSTTSRTVNAYRRYFESLDGMHEVHKDDYEAECEARMKQADENR